MDKKKQIRSFLEWAVSTFFLVYFDQWTKLLAVRNLKEQKDITLIPNVLYLKYLENRGAAFGMFENQKIFLVVLTSLILMIVCYVLWKLPAKKKFLPLKLLCFFVTAGGIGNLLDRVRLNYVVDFIYFSPINFPIFNIADIYVTMSMVILFILVLFYYKEEDFTFLKRHDKK